MLTYLVPTYKNPVGLETVLRGLLEKSETEYEVIVLMERTDPTLDLCVGVCQQPAYTENISFLIFETPSLTAKVNFAATLAKGSAVTVLNDGIILDFLHKGFDRGILTTLEGSLDKIMAIYLCSREENDNAYRWPFISKRVIEIVGYLYHPICTTPEICERWVSSVFDQLGRMVFIKDCIIVPNIQHPTNIIYPCYVRQDCEAIYKFTARVRKDTAAMLGNFIIGE